MKKWGLILSLLVIVSLVLVSTGWAQTGVGYIQQIFAKRIVISDDSSGVALTVSQSGSGMAMVVTDAGGFPVMAIDDNGDTILAPDETGGNEGAVAEFIGPPRLRIIGTGAGGDENDANETIGYVDATPAGEWITVDADSVCATEAAYSRDVDGTSLEIDFLATADANDGCFSVVPANLDWTDLESVGFWLYVEDTSLAAGDLHLAVVDSGATQYLDIPACPIANYWYWVDMTALITAFAGADANDVDGLGISLSAAGAAKALAAPFVVYVDGLYQWQATAEEALGVAVTRDGVLNCYDAVTGAVMTPQDGTTGYFTHYEDGVDFIVITGDADSMLITCLVSLVP